MTLDEILAGLFPAGHDIARGPQGTIAGRGRLRGAGSMAVIGITGGLPLGVDGALPLARHVLDTIAAGEPVPILVLVDTRGQRMARRDEMLGLNEYLAHLAKCLLLASRLGHRTVGLEYGQAAAGAFLATALATEILVALPGASPAVMDLPSIARVTKLPEDRLAEMAKTTAVFAPGLEPMVRTGAVARVWDPDRPLDLQLVAALDEASPHDDRDRRGAARGGRSLAAEVARRVADQARQVRHAAAS